MSLIGSSPLFDRVLANCYRSTTSNALNETTQYKVKGIEAWHQVNQVVILTEIMRQKGDDILIDVLSRLRTGTCTEKDKELLDRYVLSSDNCPNETKNLTDISRWVTDPKKACPLITYTNAARDAHNFESAKAFAEATGQEFHVYYSLDTRGRGKNRKEIQGAAAESAWKVPVKQAQDLGGALEIGIMISGILFGIVTGQVYIYHKNFPSDPLWLKIGLVGFIFIKLAWHADDSPDGGFGILKKQVDTIWLLEFTHTGCALHALYYYTVTHYGDPETITTAPFTLGLTALIRGIVTVMAITMLSVKAIQVATKSLTLFLEKWEWLITTSLVLRASADILVSGTLVWHLCVQRENAYKHTLKIVDKLIQWAVVIWLALATIFPQVFSNALLANINSRAHLRDLQGSEIIFGSLSAHSIPQTRTQIDTARTCGIRITVTTQSDVEMNAFEIRHVQDRLEFTDIESHQRDHKEDEEFGSRIGGIDFLSVNV
ncbi:hypothetical protein K435DRAFT_870607 [Dendrothele bispora CBS 962.96]|uniref:Uncharacterized protein n=1 Tax=Dendrothele bispora (strain CBS 962.96) TaxID=1314807 RepID=A0A4S8L672_DENBC|nr:hypothetical protein K435DRAFT_870607 [Dendrothele bispora CBS 962.96]